ncbi:MAG: hypothetical protein Q8L55_03570, partial [Phycisphaerales bacterium]|nr:hypothetical protein [Phycisphaerales bacterium]
MTRLSEKAPTAKPTRKTRAVAPAAPQPEQPPAAGNTGVAVPWRSKPDPDTRVYIGDCREVLPRIPEVRKGQIDLVFADPPFNWNRDYDRFKQGG